MAYSYDKEIVRVSEMRPTWRTHSCTKGEELNDIACQSWENMCAQHRHQDQMYAEIWRGGGWTNTTCFLTCWDPSWVEQEKWWSKRRDNSPSCSSGPWVHPGCSQRVEEADTHLSARINFHQGLICRKDCASPFSCPFFLYGTNITLLCLLSSS